MPNWEIDLAPRLILGLWHTSFILPARKHLPLLHLVHITKSLQLSTAFFAPHVSGFSVAFPLLLTPAGEAFRQSCLRENKNFGVWTVNAESEMCVAAKLGCSWILTDKPRVWNNLRAEVRPAALSFRPRALRLTLAFLPPPPQLERDFNGTMKKHVGPFFAYSSTTYYSVAHVRPPPPTLCCILPSDELTAPSRPLPQKMLDAYTRRELTALAGPFEEVPKAPSAAVGFDSAAHQAKVVA